MMEFNIYAEYMFWLPILFWVGLHFWFRNVSYVVFMKEQVNRGQKWAYVTEDYVKHPGRVSFLRFCDILFTLLTSVASAAVVVGLLQVSGFNKHAYFGFASFLVFWAVARIVKRRTEVKLTELFQSAFYLEYRRVRYEIDRKGIKMDESNVKNRAGLSYAHKLCNAENHHVFWKYVKAMAASKKVPPDIFAELY